LDMLTSVRTLTAILITATAVCLSGCQNCGGGIPEDTSRKLALETTVRTSANPPSRFFCGNVNKASASPGGCASYATDQNGPLPAVERTEIRGWIVSNEAVHWVEDDEVGFEVLLDWGWSPAASGVVPLNTPEAVVGAITPHNIITFGRNPSDFSIGGSRLSAGNSAQAWGGPFAAVIHVELQAWRTRTDGVSMPAEWTTLKTRDLATPGGGIITKQFTFPFDPELAFAEPPMQRNLAPGDYVRIVGTRWEDSCHCPAGVGVGAYLGALISDLPENDPEQPLGRSVRSCWHTGSLNLGPVGRGWTEIHPLDYLSLLPHAAINAPRPEKLELVSLCSAGEFRRDILLDPSTKPATATGIEYQKIDTAFTVTPQDIETEEVTLLPTGIQVVVKLKPRGLFQGDPKYMAGFLVKWKTSP
jgi:hypothetical protein